MGRSQEYRIKVSVLESHANTKPQFSNCLLFCSFTTLTMISELRSPDDVRHHIKWREKSTNNIIWSIEFICNSRAPKQEPSDST